MSERNAAVLRETYEAFNKHDWEAVAERCTPDITWRWGGNFLETDREGLDAVLEFFSSWIETFPDVQVEVDEILGSGDRLLAHMRQTGSGIGSGLSTGMTFSQLVTFEDGKVRDVRNYIDRDEALQAAGLS